MKRQALSLVAGLLAAGTIVSLAETALARDTYVQPYIRSDGTYVQGHFRSRPDNNPYNNYSTQGNFNPYTGQPGRVNPSQSYPSTSPYGGIWGGGTDMNPYSWPSW